MFVSQDNHWTNCIFNSREASHMFRYGFKLFNSKFKSWDGVRLLVILFKTDNLKLYTISNSYCCVFFAVFIWSQFRIEHSHSFVPRTKFKHLELTFIFQPIYIFHCLVWILDFVAFKCFLIFLPYHVGYYLTPDRQPTFWLY